MSFSQDIKYRVSIDDADFQAKLSQMRASLDMTLGNQGFSPMIGGMSGVPMGAGNFVGAGANVMGMMSAMGPRGYSPMSNDMFMGGIADFGSEIKPVTYTSPAIAMQPHFGMIAMDQTMGQALRHSIGPFGQAAGAVTPHLGMMGAGAFLGGIFGGAPGAMFGGMLGGAYSFMDKGISKDPLPMNLSAAEFMQISARQFGTKIGDLASSTALVTGTTAASLALGSVGMGLGSYLGGGIGGFMGSLIFGAPATAYGSAIGDMMANNRAIQTALEAGSFRFLSGGRDLDPITGRGFNRRSRAEIADFIQSEELNDVRFGMGEMKQILEGGMQMDLFSGTRDVEDFKGKFKGMVDTLKTITATLHTSLKEGIEVVRGFRDMGVTDPQQIQQLTMKSEMLGRMSGRTGTEMLSIGQMGAEMFRGTGIRMELGSDLIQQNVMMIRNLLNQRDANGNPVLSRETVGQAGGEIALAQQMTGSALASTQTAFGRGMMLAAFNPANNTLNMSMLSQMGSGDIMSTLARAANKSPAELFKFQAHQEEMIGEMSPMQLQLFGLSSSMAQARTVSRAFHSDFEDTFVALQLRQGVPKHLIDAQLAMLKANPNDIRKNEQQAIDQMARQASLEDVRNRYGFKALTNAFSRGFVQPIQRTLTELGTDVAEGAENMLTRIMGGTVAYTEGVTEQSVRRGEQLLNGPRTEEMDKLISSTEGRVIDATESVYTRMVGGQSSRELLEGFEKYGVRDKEKGTITYMGGTAIEFKNQEDIVKYGKENHTRMVLIRKEKGGEDSFLAVAENEVRKINKERKARELTPDQTKEADKYEVTREARTDLEKLVLRESKKGGKKTTIDEVGKLLFDEGYDPKNMVQQEIMARALQGYGLEAEKDLNIQRGKGAVDVGTITAGDAFKRGEVSEKIAKNKLMRGLRDTMPSSLGDLLTFKDRAGFANKLTADQLSIVNRLGGIDPETDEQTYLNTLDELRNSYKEGGYKLSGEEIEGIRNTVSQWKKEGDKSFGEAISSSDAYRAIGQRDKTYQGDKAPIGGSLGEVTKSTMVQMEKMSDLLVKNMELLIAKQKEFKALLGPK